MANKALGRALTGLTRGYARGLGQRRRREEIEETRAIRQAEKEEERALRGAERAETRQFRTRDAAISEILLNELDSTLQYEE